MPEYIEREVLLERMEARLKSLRNEYGNYDHYTDGFEEGCVAVEDADAADVVAVVRCKDCKRCLRDDVWGGRWCIRGVGLIQVRPDAFCSYGERIFTDNEVTREDEYIPEDIWEGDEA